MKRQIPATISCFAAVMLCMAPGFGDNGDAPVQYILQRSSPTVTLGQPPGLRLAIKNNSSADVVHNLEPTSYEVTIDGPGRYHIWFFKEHIMPIGVRINGGKTGYLFGGPTSYQYPESDYFDRAGTYHIRYCDRWLIRGRWKKICSNDLEIQVVGKVSHNGG